MNPKYGVLGMVSIPFWFFYEWMAPLLEFVGLLFVIAIILMGQANYMYIISFFVLIYSFAFMLSVIAIF